MPDHPPRIVEVTATWPAEVFIHRHLQALLPFAVTLQLVARSANPAYSQRASVQQPGETLAAITLPDFNMLSLMGKFRAMIKCGASRELLQTDLPLRHRMLLAFFKKLAPDLVHFHNAQLAVSLSWICSRLNLPYTVSMRGADVQEIPLRSEQAYQATRRALAEASGVHAVCKNLGNSIMPAGKRFTTIYTPIEFSFRLPPYQPDHRSGYLFLAVGRMHWRKGYPDLLVGLRSLLDIGIQARLIIVGSGPDEARVQQWIRAQQLDSVVETIPKASFAQIGDLLQKVHAYIQSSLAEGLSNATAEAMAWGCPVFATDVGGTAEIIEDGQTGFLLEPAAPETWAEQLILVKDSTLMEHVRVNAHRLARKLFEPQVHGQQFLDFYRTALAKGAAAKSGNGPLDPDTLDKHSLDTDDERYDVMVWGPWEWQLGSDQVLRALSRVHQPIPTRIAIVGDGSQEDELRYLSKLLRLEGVFVKLPAGAMEQEQIKSHWTSRARTVIEFKQGQQPEWRIQAAGKEQPAAIGNLIDLCQRVQRALLTDPDL